MDNDTKWAHQAIIDPLHEPDPSDETGLNSHFGSTYAPRRDNPTPPTSATTPKHGSPVEIRSQNTGSSTNTNPFRRSRASSTAKSTQPLVSFGEVHVDPRRSDAYPSPPTSASPRKERFSPRSPSHREAAFGQYHSGRPRRSSQPSGTNPFEPSSSGLARGNSLRERYPGDKSHKPLDLIRKDTKTAHRAPHLRKKNFQGADTIDKLDQSTLSYHHEGPYDAASLSRNRVSKYSPVAAVKDSNEEALKATPRENIVDAVQRHRPLEGVAIVPPGMPDRFGRVYDYQEGADLMREPNGTDAGYRRWAGVEYLPGDLKGKGEPSYSIEEALKNRKEIGETGTEMQSRRRNKSLGTQDDPFQDRNSRDAEVSTGIGRSNTTGKSAGGTLKKRLGSLGKRKE